jgi:aminopeptidase N
MFSKSERMWIVVCATILLFTPSLQAKSVSPTSAEPVLDHAWRQFEYPPDYFTAAVGDNTRIYQEVDILHYTIDANFLLGASYPDTAYLEAVTTIEGQAKGETLDELIIDFYENITINSLKFNDVEFNNYVRSDDKIWMDLSSDPLDPAEAFEVTIDYTRIYGSAYQGIMFRSHGDTDTPAICSIDQPYRSPQWWPCFDYPGDKATADIYMTYPDWMTAVSNGLLQSEVDNGDGTKTSHYREDYQAYTSALSVAMTDYETWSDTYVSPLDGTTMPLVYYAFPEDRAKAEVDYDVTADAIVYFAQIYGEYPFINEKYGIAETPNSFGSLEHQTITSLTYVATQREINWDVIVHELAHQWWGDWVTCHTWNHLWLHEGFATYSEVLFHEQDTGEPAGPFMALEYDDGEYDGYLSGTVYTEDEHLYNPFLEIGAVYEKAGWVLHMLRQIMGDTAFFTAVKTFGTNHAHSTAVTDDLKVALEAEYGSPLDEFFDQWVYTPYRPIYSVMYENATRPGGYKVGVILEQTQDHMIHDINGPTSRNYYVMPVDFTVHYTDETTETFTITNNQRLQIFQLETTKEPDYTVLDEQFSILRIVEEQPSDDDGIPGDGDNSGVLGDNTCVGGAIEDCDDNCHNLYNPAQEDTYPPGGNGIGDACECEGNFDCDEDCDGTDAATFKIDFGRSSFFNPCTNGLPCNGDFDCDSDCDGTDAAKFKEDFGRSIFSNPCPTCTVGDWCSYPEG